MKILKKLADYIKKNGPAFGVVEARFITANGEIVEIILTSKEVKIRE